MTTMNRLYLIELYDLRQSRNPCLLISAEDKDSAERCAEDYAYDRKMRLRCVTFVCVTPEPVFMEI